MTPQYLNLKVRAPFRLADLKQKASALNAASWRDVRSGTFRGPVRELSQGFNGSKPVWYTHCGPAFPRETWADEVEHSPVDHRGWYADPDGDNTYRGFVAALPRGRFLAGYYMRDSGERVYFNRVFDDALDAASWADGQARYDAEIECTYQTRWREARDLEDAIEAYTDCLREALALRNHKCFSHMRRRVAALLCSLRSSREKLANEYADCA